jgi:hypothetical protein
MPCRRGWQISLWRRDMTQSTREHMVCIRLVTTKSSLAPPRKIVSWSRQTPTSAQSWLLSRLADLRSSSSGNRNLFIARDYADRLISVLPLLEPALTAGCVAVSDEVVCGSVGCLFRDNAGKKGPVNLTHNACRAD